MILQAFSRGIFCDEIWVEELKRKRLKLSIPTTEAKHSIGWVHLGLGTIDSQESFRLECEGVMMIGRIMIKEPGM